MNKISVCLPEHGSNVICGDTIGCIPCINSTSCNISIAPINAENAEFDDVIGLLCDIAYEDYRISLYSEVTV